MRPFQARAGRGIVFFLFACLSVFGIRLWGYEIQDDREVTSKKPVLIRSKHLEYDRLKSLTLFKGKVVATHGQVVLTADEVQAIADYREASASGNVKVTDKTSGTVMTCGNLE